MDLRAAALALLPALLGGCKPEKPVAQVSFSVRTTDVFIVRGDSGAQALSQTPDAADTEYLYDASGMVLLGKDIVQPAGCKVLPIYWVPTRPEETPPTTDRTGSVCARMSEVTAGSWKKASATMDIFSENEAYRVRIDAAGLVQNGVYSAWLAYLDGQGKTYAIAPIGGFPNLLFTEPDGSAHFDRLTSTRALRSHSLLVNAVATVPGAQAHAPTIADDTMIAVMLFYHSNAQSNGNASKTTRQIPAGRVAVVGELGTDVHTHLLGMLSPLP